MLGIHVSTPPTSNSALEQAAIPSRSWQLPSRRTRLAGLGQERSGPPLLTAGVICREARMWRCRHLVLFLVFVLSLVQTHRVIADSQEQQAPIFPVISVVAGRHVQRSPNLPVIIAGLKAAKRVESFLVEGGELDPRSAIPNIGNYRIAASGPGADSSLALSLIPLIERVAQGRCGEPTACVFEPRFALRFHDQEPPLDLLVELKCASLMMFSRGDWVASWLVKDEHGDFLLDEQGNPLPGMECYGRCVKDSLEAIFLRLFPAQRDSNECR
jgi:hypothetical protein